MQISSVAVPAPGGVAELRAPRTELPAHRSRLLCWDSRLRFRPTCSVVRHISRYLVKMLCNK